MPMSAVTSERGDGVHRSSDRGAWAAGASTRSGWGFRQSPAYSEAGAARRGASCEFVVVWTSGRAIASASVRVKSVPIPGAGLAYISGGPLVAADDDTERSNDALRDSVRALRAEYVVRRRLTLRIAPPVGPGPRNARVAEVYASMGFAPSASAPRYRTILVDLSRDEDALRSSMAQKWRNQLNGALRQETTLHFSREPDALVRFAPLFDETSSRKGFSTELGADFYHRVQQTASADDRLVVVIASHGGEDVAGAALDIRGETATYILGATTEAGKKCKAAYALHWRAMLLAKESGCQWYDLGGVDPERNPGVHHFKLGFGGEEVFAPGPFDARPPGLAGWMGAAAERAHKHAHEWRTRRERRSSESQEPR